MADRFYVSISGDTQGKFKGEGTPKPYEEKIAGLYYKFGGWTTRGAHGAATGKRQYEPIVFRKELGASSPQLFCALAANESLSVLFEFIRVRPDGGEAVFYTVKLTKAHIATLVRCIDPQTNGATNIEEVALTFDKIEEENKQARTIAADTWTGYGNDR
jgi:type VI secretion system secreted protein Hcp